MHAQRSQFVITVTCAIVAVVLAASLFQVRAKEEESDAALRLTVDSLPAAPTAVSLTRMTLAPGAAREMLVPGPELYSVESGTLGIRVDGPAFLTHASKEKEQSRVEEMEPRVDYTLQPGDQALVLVRVAHHLMNDGMEPASFLNVVVYPSSSALPSWLPEAELPQGVAETLLASETIEEPGVLPDQQAEIAVHRTTVSPDSEVPQAMTEGFALILVEEGELSVSAAGQSPTSHVAGDVIRVTPDEPLKGRNDGKETLKITALTISSADAKADD